MVEMMVHSLVVPVIKSQPALSVVDTKVIDKYILLDSQMLDVVSLSLHKDEYWAWAREIQKDKNLDLDNEHPYFDLDEDDLLDDSEQVFMVDTQSSLLCEPPTGTISWDVDVEKGKVLDST